MLPQDFTPTTLDAAKLNCELIIISLMAHAQLTDPNLPEAAAESLIIANGGCPCTVVAEA